MLKIEIDFVDALIDIDRKITIKGASPNAEVLVRTKTERAGQVWRSEHKYQADKNGQVDLKTEPATDDEKEISALAIIYTQQAENASASCLLNPMVYHPLHTEIEAESEAQSASHVLTQRLLPETVQRVEVDEPDFKGLLFVPATTNSKAAVLVLKEKTNSALDESHAALYGARGYIALALDYDASDVQNVLVFQEKIAQVLEWLRETMRPKNSFVAVSGYREGADLALNLAIALAAQVSALIACEPTQVKPTCIEVENVQGPVLIASGQLHSGQAYNQELANRLQKTGFDYRFQWYSFQAVNQGLSFPHLPTTLSTHSKAEALVLAEASKELWFGIIGFLHQAVAEAGAPTQLDA